MYQKAKNQILSNSARNGNRQGEENDSQIFSLKQQIGFPTSNNASGSSFNEKQSYEFQKLQKQAFLLKEEIEKQKILAINYQQKGKQEVEEIYVRQIQQLNKKIEQLTKSNEGLKEEMISGNTQLKYKIDDLKEKELAFSQLKSELNEAVEEIEKQSSQIQFINDRCTIKKLRQNYCINYINSKIIHHHSKSFIIILNHQFIKKGQQNPAKTSQLIQVEHQCVLLEVDKKNLQKQVPFQYSSEQLFHCELVSQKGQFD